MKIAIIGASGFIGSNLVDEALSRGHEVFAIYRRNAIKDRPNLTQFKMTIFDEETFENVIKGADVILSTYNPGYYHVAQKERYLDAYEVIFRLVKKLNKRIIVVIGATSLYQKDGQLVSSGFYPAMWKYALQGPDLVYEKYKDDQSIQKTFVSPSAELIDYVKTKNYVYDTNTLIENDKGESRVSVQDLADAILNETESPKYQGKRFTIGYLKWYNIRQS